MRLMINGLEWDIWFVPWNDDNLYMPSTFDYRLGMCNLDSQEIYIREDLPIEKMLDVLMHELSHAFVCAYQYGFSEKFDEELAQFNGRFSDDIYLDAEDALHYYGYE